MAPLTAYLRFVDDKTGKTVRTSKKDIPSNEDQRIQLLVAYLQDRLKRTVDELVPTDEKECKGDGRRILTFAVSFADDVHKCCGKFADGRACTAYPKHIVGHRGACGRHKDQLPAPKRRLPRRARSSVDDDWKPSGIQSSRV